MKKLIAFLFILSLSSLFSCNKDECSNIKCLNNGTCVNGTCDCQLGYSGANCGNQITPEKIKITNIKVTKFPATDNGAGWDLTSGLDIYITLVYNKNIVYKHSTYYSDASPNDNYDFHPDINLYFDNPLDEYSIVLYDFDSFDSDDFMGGVIFTPYFNTNNFPNIRYIDAGGEVSFEVSVNYVF